MEDARTTATTAVQGIEELDSPAAGTGQQPAEVSGTFVAYMDDSSALQQSPQSAEPSISAKALDRWFRTRNKNQGAPRLLEIPNEALVNSAGPIHVTGNITLVQEDGSVTYANHLSLCRCGASRAKPECDGRHLDVEFLNSGRIQEVSDTLNSERPCKITISCIKNGPVTFRGRLRLHNGLGQECVKQRGALCRCGHSANKPFCDGSHERLGFRTGR